ncbi:MAG: HNH endonuclease [Terracidiphilus sp.]
MPKRVGWSREQLILAFKLYCNIPFGKMDSRNPQIIRYARIIGRSPSALAMKLTNIASLDPAIRSTGRKGLTGASQADREMWDEMTNDWSRFAEEIARTEHALASGPILDDSQEASSDASTSYLGGTRSALIEARLGQGFFRAAVLSSYEYKCCISGIAIPELLVASHIVPWKTDVGNRLNPRNGLCLSSIHDRAFDLGLITISPDFRLMLSKRMRMIKPNPYLRHTFHDYADKAISLPEKFSPDPEFLRFHREIIFVEGARHHEH